MTLKELTDRTSLKAIGREIGLDVFMMEGHLQCVPLDAADPRYSTDLTLPSWPMVDACRTDDHPLFHPWIEAGLLTNEQMRHACQRYHLGQTKSGQPLFWMIDNLQHPLDAHIGSSCWLSQLLKSREPLIQSWRVTHCLFGQHLLMTNTPSPYSPPYGGKATDRRALLGNGALCLVESEPSALILSELFPDALWMAYVTIPHLTPNLFAPLEGHTVTIYPRTDPTGSTLLFFQNLAAHVTQCYPAITITVDPLLELHATPDQKRRNIDLADYLLESSPP